jgi:hypothetical protein
VSDSTKGDCGLSFKFPPMMGIVRELRYENPRFGQATATAKVMLFDAYGAETWVDVPVSSVANQLDHRTRWLVEINVRALGDGENFPNQ